MQLLTINNIQKVPQRKWDQLTSQSPKNLKNFCSDTKCNFNIKLLLFPNTGKFKNYSNRQRSITTI